MKERKVTLEWESKRKKVEHIKIGKIGIRINYTLLNEQMKKLKVKVVSVGHNQACRSSHKVVYR